MPIHRKLIVAAALLAPVSALAEGQAELDVQELENTTELLVDILDSTVETFVFTGTGTIAVTAPDGTSMGSYRSGQEITPLAGQDGAYAIALGVRQSGAWDIAVRNPVASGGRLSSLRWYLDAGSYSESAAFTGSFYALVPAGGEGYDQTIEMRCNGLAGNRWRMSANSTGVDGTNAGRSVPLEGNSYDGTYRIYLSPPAIAQNNAAEPHVSNEVWSVPGVCESVVTGTADAVFTFDSDVEGTYHVVCDLDGNGEFDLSSDDDVSITGEAHIGSNAVHWDGTDNAGNPVDAGDYACQIVLSIGEYHFIASDIETSYEGLRLFALDADGARRGMPMYWNDEILVNLDLAMPNGEAPLASSGGQGVDPGDYVDATDPNVNARAWGDFVSRSKGNDALLDTFAWIDSVESQTLTVVVVDADGDTDGDSLLDADEDCGLGTDPFVADTDGDGADDGDEIGGGTDPLDADSDDDGLSDGDESFLGTDPLVGDSDGDGLLDGEEATSAAEAPDTDGDGAIDALDDDDDGDGILTAEEAAWAESDVDGDGTPNWLDTDSDGDGALDADEGTIDANGEGTPDYLDPTIPVPPVEQWYQGGCATGAGPAWLGLAALAAVRTRRSRLTR